jgi:hypothetical protein
VYRSHVKQTRTPGVGVTIRTTLVFLLTQAWTRSPGEMPAIPTDPPMVMTRRAATPPATAARFEKRDVSDVSTWIPSAELPASGRPCPIRWREGDPHTT